MIISQFLVHGAVYRTVVLLCYVDVAKIGNSCINILNAVKKPFVYNAIKQ